MAYSVLSTAAFEGDLDAAVAYYLEQSGPKSAAGFLDKYDLFCELVSSVPRYGSSIGDTGVRWRPLGVFVAVYSIDDTAEAITLLRLYYVSSNWRERVSKQKRRE